MTAPYYFFASNSVARIAIPDRNTRGLFPFQFLSDFLRRTSGEQRGTTRQLAASANAGRIFYSSRSISATENFPRNCTKMLGGVGALRFRTSPHVGITA